MTQKFANAARAYLASSISDSATTVTIDGGGSLFPAITSPEFSRAVLQDNTGIEVVLITAHTASSNSFTVTRAQEGTTARSFAAGAVFGLRMTAADGDTFVAKVSGPGSATDSALAAFDGTTGKLIKQAATVTIAQGGTGQTTRQAAMDALAGAVTAGQYLRGDGTDVVMSAIQAADVPTLNQNTTGNAATATTATNVTGTVAIAQGGTGQTTRQAAMDALAGAVTAGQYLRGDGADVVMSAIQAADVPTLNQSTTGTAANVTGTVAVVNGGTGQTSYIDGQLLIGNTTGNTLTKATLTAGSGVTITNGAGSITIAASGGGGGGSVGFEQSFLLMGA